MLNFGHFGRKVMSRDYKVFVLVERLCREIIKSSFW